MKRVRFALGVAVIAALFCGSLVLFVRSFERLVAESSESDRERCARLCGDAGIHALDAFGGCTCNAPGSNP